MPPYGAICFPMGKLFDDLQRQDAARKKPVVLQAPAGVRVGSHVAPTREPEGSPSGEVAGAAKTAGKDILLEGVPAAMLVRLEEERKRRGLRSRAETIRILLSEALK